MGIKAPLVALLGAFTASAALGQADPAIAAATDSYGKCIKSTALRLSTGPDAADVIARSAVAACEAEARAIFIAWGRDNFTTAERWVEKTEKQVVGATTLEILERRRK